MWPTHKRGKTGRKIVTHLPLLLIDDEADHASVDTGEQVFDADGKPDEEHAPTAINSHRFSVAIVATCTGGMRVPQMAVPGPRRIRRVCRAARASTA